MKTIKRDYKGLVFQGDVLLRRVSTLPNGATAQKEAIVAHSETGHHHVAEGAEVLTVPPGRELYFRALGRHVDIVHQRSYDTHETLRLESLPGDVWEVVPQREYVPQGWRRVED